MKRKYEPWILIISLSRINILNMLECQCAESDYLRLFLFWRTLPYILFHVVCIIWVYYESLLGWGISIDRSSNYKWQITKDNNSYAYFSISVLISMWFQNRFKYKIEKHKRRFAYCGIIIFSLNSPPTFCKKIISKFISISISSELVSN